MEQQVWNSCEHSLNVSPNLQALASARSLIINPSTSDSTLFSLLETLARFLQLHAHHHPHLLHHALKLLSDIAHRHIRFSPLVFDFVRKHSLLESNSTRLAAQSLALLAAVADHDRSLVSAMDEIGEDVFLSLCFRPSVSVRTWLLLNADSFSVRPSLLLTVFLGFTKDPYPYVRRVALDRLVGLCKAVVFEDRGLIEGCYCRAVELLRDMEDCIRSAAIRAVSEWGLRLVALHVEESRRDWSDAVFVQLCSMVRDMCVEVRVEAFDALGRVGMVSGDILLQTLSKKVLGITKGKKHLDQCSAKELETEASSVAGAFVHGLEDEFYEVRRSACRSLRTLTILSAEFAGEALDLLMDMLNDDSMVVRLQALETMHHMATFDCLKVQETHMHMFLGTLVDSSILIRSAARKILRSVKLPSFEMFKSCIDGLLENLEIYPQDEADVFSVLFKIGQIHGNFVLCIIKEAFPEMEPSCEGKFDPDSTRVAALLVLAISVPLSYEQPVCGMPPRIFSYAVTFLGRISRALSDIMSQSTLLAYLSSCSRSTISPAAEFDFKEEDPLLPFVEGDITNYTSGRVATSQVELMAHDEETNSMNLILAKVKDLWPLIQSGYMREVLRTLRNCKEELATFMTNSLGCAAALALTSQYLRVVKLLARAWEHFLPPRKLLSCSMGGLDLALGKLERSLTEMRYRFIGLSKEEELYVLELILVTFILRLSKAETCHHCTTLKKLSNTISHVKFLCEEGSIKPPNIAVELDKLLCEVGTSIDGASYSPFLFKKLLDFFSLKQFVFHGSLKHIKAELEVPGYDAVNPLPFIPGLPVGILFEITLYNILDENRLWLMMTVAEELTQFIFLDSDHYGGPDEVRKFSVRAPFYRTPKAVSFKMRVSIGMECLFEDVHFFKGCGGPKHELTRLCREKEIYFSWLTKTE